MGTTINVGRLEWRKDSMDLDGGVLLGWGLALLGVPMHVLAIRVKDDQDEQQGHTEVAEDLLINLAGIYEQALQTTEIPGFEGRYVIVAHPHGA